MNTFYDVNSRDSCISSYRLRLSSVLYNNGFTGANGAARRLISTAGDKAYVKINNSGALCHLFYWYSHTDLTILHPLTLINAVLK